MGDATVMSQSWEISGKLSDIMVTMEEEVVDVESSTGLNGKRACSRVGDGAGKRGRRTAGAAVLEGSASWGSVLKDLCG